MKIIISEKQLSEIRDKTKLKKYFEKYWQKYPKLDDDFFNFFDLDKFERYNEENEFKKIFRDFLGGDENASHKATELMRVKPLHIDCGGYDFDISIPTITKMDDTTLKVEIILDDENGFVEIFSTGEGKTLTDALNNDDYGWEVEQEVNDCIFEFLQKIITENTGVDIVIDKVSFLSDIPE